MTKASAAFDVAISTAATSNMSYSSGVYTPTATPAILNVGDLVTKVNAGDVTVQTTGASGSEPGNITIASSITFGGALVPPHTLTLDSKHSVMVGTSSTPSVHMSVSGAAGLTLKTNDTGSGGQFSLINGGYVTFSSLTQTLYIKGLLYALVNDLATIGTKAGSCPCALSTSFDASSHPQTSAPATDLTAMFEGLGNTISNLTIADSTPGDPAALFAHVGTAGIVRNLTLTAVNISGASDAMTTSQNAVGALVAWNEGTLENDSVLSVPGTVGQVSMTCTGSNCSTHLTDIGGLVGLNYGTITNAEADATVSTAVDGSYIGGLVGSSYGQPTELAAVENSDSHATVTGSNGVDDSVGGLVGLNTGATINNSFATGTVDCGGHSDAGGLAGDNEANPNYSTLVGLILSSYATGNVSPTATCGASGGLVGRNGSVIGVTGLGAPATSYATGQVQAYIYAGGLVAINGGIINYAYATGNVTGLAYAGGLVAANNGDTSATAKISQSFSTGTVTSAGSFSVGGLVGLSDEWSQIDNSYSAGAVTSPSSGTGGFVGTTDSNSLSSTVITDVYEIGYVTPPTSGQCIGAFAGENNSSSVSDSYWDSTINTSINGVGPGTCSTSSTGITPMTSPDLQSGVPSPWSTTIWGTNPSINGGFPYLKANHL